MIRVDFLAENSPSRISTMTTLRILLTRKNHYGSTPNGSFELHIEQHNTAKSTRHRQRTTLKAESQNQNKDKQQNE